uniref:Uncharacterized protein n=1 Tax=Graphocephala atropunctata TaxID=36148 RepID=A0A1B6LQ35_9HEMI
MADPKGVGSPWYVKTVKKDELDKEEEEKQENDKKKFKEDREKRKKEKKEKEELEAEEKKKEEEEKAEKEKKIQRKIEKRKKEKKMLKKKKEQEDIDREEIGQGVRESETDFRPELKWMMDFIRDVDEKERERRGESLRWKKEEIEEEIETHMAKEAFTSDFKTLIQTFIEAEWSRVDDKLKKLEKDEKRRRRKLFKEMEPLAKDMMDEGKRTDMLYRAAMRRKKGAGEGKSSVMEDMIVGMIMQQMDRMAKPREDIFANFPLSLF